MITFNDFVNYTDTYFSTNKNDGIRYGQSIMNTLFMKWPTKYREITNTEYDCFYDDKICKLTLSKLENEWINQK